MSPGVSIRSSSGPNVTFIDGEGLRHGLVGTDLGSPTIEGITFLNCRTQGVGGGGEKWGGGLLLFNSSADISGNRFVECVAGNGADGGGGGIFLYSGSGTEIHDNVFLRCSATDIGGAMEAVFPSGLDIHNNTFVDNDCLDTGGGQPHARDRPEARRPARAPPKKERPPSGDRSKVGSPGWTDWGKLYRSRL
jgi:Right handed beta helix region